VKLSESPKTAARLVDGLFPSSGRRLPGPSLHPRHPAGWPRAQCAVAPPSATGGSFARAFKKFQFLDITPNAEAMLLFTTGFKPGVSLDIESVGGPAVQKGARQGPCAGVGSLGRVQTGFIVRLGNRQLRAPVSWRCVAFDRAAGGGRGGNDGAEYATAVDSS
jgi:hypothetical protein